jgi:hypothetical protein
MTSAQTWRLRDVADAAQMKPRALRQCFEIGALKLNGLDKPSGGSGQPVGLSRHRAYQAAAMKHLHNNGLSIPHAARIAFQFSDVGSMGRPPGSVFEHGRTVILVGPDGASIKNIFAATSFSDVISNCSPCFIAVDMNKIVEAVNTVLNERKNLN